MTVYRPLVMIAGTPTGLPVGDVISGFPPAGSDTHVQFNDAGAFGADGYLLYNKVAHTFTVLNEQVRVIDGVTADLSAYDTLHLQYNAAGKGVQIGDTAMDHPLTVYGKGTFGTPITALTYIMGASAYTSAVRGISADGQWGVMGFSRSSDLGGAGGAMATIGVYGHVRNNSNNSVYGMYSEAYKEYNTSYSTAACEFAIMNRYNSQVDLTQASIPAGFTAGLGISSGITYDAGTDYDTSVGIYLARVNSSFRRGIVITNNCLKDLGGSKLVALAVPANARLAWDDDDDCIMGTGSVINTLIANSIISSVMSTGLKVNGNLMLNENGILELCYNTAPGEYYIQGSETYTAFVLVTNGVYGAIFYPTGTSINIGGTLMTLSVDGGGVVHAA